MLLRSALCVISFSATALAQPPPPPVGAGDLVCGAETPPELVGGLEALQAAAVYPDGARADGVEGRVILQFVVRADGSMTDPVVVRSPDPRLSRAALGALARLRFEPGRQRGRPVAVRFALPVTFRLAVGVRQP